MASIKPFMTKEINTDDWSDEMQDGIRPYLAMSDRLLLFPNSEMSTLVWDMEDERGVGVLEGHTARIVNASFDTTGGKAVTFACDKEFGPCAVKVWSLDTMQCTADLTSPTYVFSLLGDRLLLDSEKGPIKVWDIGGSAPVALMDLEGHDGAVYSISASDVSNIALSGSNDGTVRLWDLRTAQCVRVMEGHTDTVRSVSMDSACQTAVSGADDMMVKVWDLGSGRCIDKYKDSLGAHKVAMHESGSSFLAACGDVYLHAWITASGFNQLILDADLSSLCGSSYIYPSIAVSRDLSRVGICYLNTDEDGLGVSVWK